MIKNSSLGIFLLLTISCVSSSFANTHHKPTASEHIKSPHKNTIKADKKPTISEPQIIFYSNHKNKNNYVVALFTDRSGKALIAYDSPTCQANSFGDTTINSKDKSEIQFTSTEDPLCKITLQVNNNQLKITKETPACTAWHGDFCSFSSLSPLTRIYPQ